jgi:hypothetical protein
MPMPAEMPAELTMRPWSTQGVFSRMSSWGNSARSSAMSPVGP